MSNKNNWMWAYWCCKKGDNNPVTMLHEVKPLTTKYGCICATLYCVSIKLTAYWNFSLPFTSRPAYSSRSLFANQSELEIIYLFAMFTFGLLPICISDTIIYGFCRHVFHGASQHPCNPCNNVPLLLKETKQMSCRQTSNFFFFFGHRKSRLKVPTLLCFSYNSNFRITASESRSKYFISILGILTTASSHITFLYVIYSHVNK